MHAPATRIVLLAVIAALNTAAQQAPAAVEPTQATTPAVAIPQDIQTFLGEIAASYAKLEHLTLAGTLTADIDAASQKQLETRPFTSAYLKPNFFRHELTGEITLGSTGQQLFIYQGKLDRYASSHPRAEKRPQLFDLLADPHENTNLAAANPEVVARLAPRTP